MCVFVCVCVCVYVCTCVYVCVRACVPLQVQYKKGHDERKAKYTSLADPPEVELAKRVANQRSDVSKTILNSGIKE